MQGDPHGELDLFPEELSWETPVGMVGRGHHDVVMLGKILTELTQEKG